MNRITAGLSEATRVQHPPFNPTMYRQHGVSSVPPSLERQNEEPWWMDKPREQKVNPPPPNSVNTTSVGFGAPSVKEKHKAEKEEGSQRKSRKIESHLMGRDGNPAKVCRHLNF